jgi:KaiC/GvpD/RAD55 family RecA-like ATPase
LTKIPINTTEETRVQLTKKTREMAPAQFQTRRLPEELSEFLSRDTYSLMIKGESGTGKTILALTILEALQPLENVLYISTRTSPLQLFEYYPWIEGIFPPVAENQGSDTKVAEGWESVVDSRLDEPNAVFERITNVLMDKQAPTVVIDSWEALGDSMGSDPLKTDLRVLETWRERAGARFLFIGEDPTDTTLDHLVEGVVVLAERKLEGRRVRELTMSKLHGMQIQRPSHFFTLEGGKFTCFPEYSAEDYAFYRPLPVRLDRPIKREKGRVSTGHDALDGALKGGLPLQGTTLISLGDGVTYDVGLVLLSKLVQGWAEAGGKVVVHPPEDEGKDFARQYSEAFGKGGKVTVAAKPGRLPSGPILAITAPPSGKASIEAPKSATVIVIAAGGTHVLHPTASVKLVVSLIEGTLFVRGELPWTPLFGVVPTPSGGNPTVYLEPVV